MPPQQQSASHRFHSYCVYSPTDFTEFTETLAGDILPQISQIYTDGLSAKDPPTDCTEFTEPSAGDNLPQISQIYTDGLTAEDSPTDFTDQHRLFGCVDSSGGLRPPQ